MKKNIEIKNSSGKNIKALIMTLSNEHIDKILKLQDDIFNMLEDKSLFAKTQKEEFEDMINKNGELIGIVTEENNLIAFGAMVKPELEEFNLGYDLNFEDEKLVKIAHMESTVVHPNYRGNKLQKIICENLEKVAKDKNCSIFCATVSPNNEFSLNTLLSLNYKIAIEKEKYGGLKRYIVIKE